MDTDTLNLLAGRSRVNFLWKRLMGSTVLDATIHTSDTGHDDETDDATASTTTTARWVVAESSSVRGYAHCGVAPSPFRPPRDTGPAEAGAAPPLTLLLVNLDNSSTVSPCIENHHSEDHL